MLPLPVAGCGGANPCEDVEGRGEAAAVAAWDLGVRVGAIVGAVAMGLKSNWGDTWHSADRAQIGGWPRFLRNVGATPLRSETPLEFFRRTYRGPTAQFNFIEGFGVKA